MSEEDWSHESYINSVRWYMKKVRTFDMDNHTIYEESDFIWHALALITSLAAMKQN